MSFSISSTIFYGLIFIAYTYFFRKKYTQKESMNIVAGYSMHSSHQLIWCCAILRYSGGWRSWLICPYLHMSWWYLPLLSRNAQTFMVISDREYGGGIWLLHSTACLPCSALLYCRILEPTVYIHLHILYPRSVSVFITSFLVLVFILENDK